MTHGKLAIRYARAFLHSQQAKHKEDVAYGELCRLEAAFNDLPTLSHALASPDIVGEEKIQLLITAAACPPKSDTAAFFRFVLSNKRIAYIDSIARMYGKLYRESKHLCIGTLTTATTLDAKTQQTIAEHFGQMQNATLELHTQTNPALIGGFVLDVEDQRLDASIKGQIQKLYNYAGH